MGHSAHLYGEESWRTISIVTMDGEPYAYQQRQEARVVKRKEDKFRGHDNYYDTAVVDAEDHRLVPVSETVSEEHTKELVEGFK